MSTFAPDQLRVGLATSAAAAVMLLAACGGSATPEEPVSATTPATAESAQASVSSAPSSAATTANATPAIAVGDCYDLTRAMLQDTDTLPSDVEAVDCTEPHTVEVFDVVDVPSGQSVGEAEQACDRSRLDPYGGVMQQSGLVVDVYPTRLMRWGLATPKQPGQSQTVACLAGLYRIDGGKEVVETVEVPLSAYEGGPDKLPELRICVAPDEDGYLNVKTATTASCTDPSSYVVTGLVDISAGLGTKSYPGLKRVRSYVGSICGDSWLGPSKSNWRDDGSVWGWCFRSVRDAPDDLPTER